MPHLRELLEKGRKNGVTDLVWLDAGAAKALEPELRVAAALHSPSTGIVDSHRCGNQGLQSLNMRMWSLPRGLCVLGCPLALAWMLCP